ncbi:MAG: extracellular solute-binding protein [Chloroflexi bacterium]|nr:extracellular solute-binding protein [Chloroflexota bacterium]
MRTYKILTASLLLALALIAAACGGAPAPTAAPPTAAPAQPTAVPAQPTAAPVQPTAAPEPTKAAQVTNPPSSPEMVDAIDLTGKNVTVVYWHNRPQKDQDLLQSMLDEFNKSNPYGIKATAEIAGASYPDVYNKVNAAIQAGQPPEMSVAYQNQAAFYRNQSAVIDLNPFVNSKKYGLSDADLKDYFPAFLSSDENPQFKNERLGFPTQRSMEVMYHNKDWLKQLGYDAAPTDWKTWEEIACKASDPAKNKYGWAFRHDASNFASQVFSRGGRILAPDGQSYAFNSQAGQDTLAMIQRMFKAKCAVEIPTSERFGEQNRFANGDILFVFASSSGLPFYQDAVSKGGKFAWDIALLPNTGKPTVNLYGASVSVYKTTPEKELAAWLVLKFLGEKAQTAKWSVNTGYLPVRQSAKDEVVTFFKTSPQWKDVADTYGKMFDWAQYAMIESPVAGYDPVRKMLDEEVMSKVISDPNADVKKLLDDAVAKANDILKENAPK